DRFDVEDLSPPTGRVSRLPLNRSLEPRHRVWSWATWSEDIMASWACFGPWVTARVGRTRTVILPKLSGSEDAAMWAERNSRCGPRTGVLRRLLDAAVSGAAAGT